MGPRTMPLRIPSYWLHKPTGQAVVTVSGKDHYLGRYDSPESRAAYDRLLAERLANRRHQSEVSTGQPTLTVNELLVAYWLHVQAYYLKGWQGHVGTG